MPRSLVIALFVSACLAGCSHPVDSANDKAEETVRKSCELCAEERGTTVLACMAFFEPFLLDEGERECLKAVGDRHESAGPYFDCVDDKAGEYQSCMDSAGCNMAAIENCGDILGSIEDTCPLPSGDALEEINAC